MESFREGTGGPLQNSSTGDAKFSPASDRDDPVGQKRTRLSNTGSPVPGTKKLKGDPAQDHGTSDPSGDCFPQVVWKTLDNWSAFEETLRTLGFVEFEDLSYQEMKNYLKRFLRGSQIYSVFRAAVQLGQVSGRRPDQDRSCYFGY